MTIRGIAWLGLMTLGGMISAAVTLYGVYAALRVDFRFDPVLTSLYCLLPLLCFPSFLLIRPAERSAALLAIFACGYLIVYSALSWRTCAELGYCGSIPATVVGILKTRTMLMFFGAAILRIMSLYAEDHSAYGARR